MAGTALDLSGINVSQAVEKMNNQVLSAEKFDLDMKEKRLVEFMSDIETAELNDALIQRNTLSIADKIQGFKDEWSGVMAEKNGRLTTQDRIKMKQAQGKINREVQRLNGIQKEFERGQQEIKFGRNAHMYNQEEFQKRSEEWVLKGTPPPNDTFLDIRSANLRDVFASERRPQRLTSEANFPIVNGNVMGNTRNVFADDKMRTNRAIEVIASNPMARKGAIEGFAALEEDQKQEYIRISTQTNIPPQTLYAIDIAKETLWKDEVIDTTRELRDTQGREISVVNAIKKPIWEDAPRIIQGKEYQGWNMQHMGLSAPKGVLIEEAFNLNTGKKESMDDSAEIISYQYYDPQKEVLVVRIKSDKPVEVPRLNDNGEQLYEIYGVNENGQRSGKSTPNLYTKEEAERLVAESKREGTKFLGMEWTKARNYEIVAKTATRSGVPQTYEIDISNGKNRSVLPDTLRKIMPNKAAKNTPRISVTPGSVI